MISQMTTYKMVLNRPLRFAHLCFQHVAKGEPSLNNSKAGQWFLHNKYHVFSFGKECCACMCMCVWGDFCRWRGLGTLGVGLWADSVSGMGTTVTVDLGSVGGLLLICVCVCARISF